MRKLLKRFLKLVFWTILIICVSGFAILLSGYFAASKPRPFLPKNNPDWLHQAPSSLNQTEIDHAGYKLLVGKDGSICVNSIGGKPIMTNLTYYASYEGSSEKWGLDKVSVIATSDSTISIDGEGQSGTLVALLITMPKNRPRLDVNIKTHYSSNAVVDRESLVAGFSGPVSQVYTKNRGIDQEKMEPVYWLDRQGALFGSGSESALIYNTPLVSSLQLDSKRNLLYINLDYYLDHPFVNIPYQENSGGKWIDISKSQYLAGDERNNKFSVFFGTGSESIPRIMLVPKGYLAGYVFTEHADGGSIKTHRAAYFGSEDITRIDSATGGFAGHKIPVTKSVFYVDPDAAKYSSIRDDPDFPQFLDFLTQLNDSGIYDICLHTPENLNSNHEILEESIKFMKSRFDTKTWIDHGMYNGIINRECISADGLNPESQFYAADLWEKYDTRYFWSPAVEMIRNYSLKEQVKKLKFLEVSEHLWDRYLSPDELHSTSFIHAFKEMKIRYTDKGELNSQKSYSGSAFPTPLYWQNPAINRDLYSWVTDYEKETANLSLKKIDTDQRQLNKLVSDRGIFVDHGYFVRNERNDGNLVEKNGKLVINPLFDKILENMARMRDKGDLYLTTIRNLLDYWILTEKISFDYMPDGLIYINNNNNEPITGLSLIVRAQTVRINGEIPKSRREGEDTIFWFDIPANQTMTIQIGNN